MQTLSRAGGPYPKALLELTGYGEHAVVRLGFLQTVHENILQTPKISFGFVKKNSHFCEINQKLYFFLG